VEKLLFQHPKVQQCMQKQVDDMKQIMGMHNTVPVAEYVAESVGADKKDDDEYPTASIDKWQD